MGKFVKGDVVVIPFPFSDLTGKKRRPAFVVSVLPGDDIILCQITSSAVERRLQGRKLIINLLNKNSGIPVLFVIFGF